MKNRFKFIRSILADPWHMHQASALGLMPVVMQLINGQLKSEFDEDEMTIPEGINPSAERVISRYQRFSSEAYVSERDTWYYDDFPIKLSGGILMIPVVGAISQEDYCGTAGTKTISAWYDKALNDPEIKAIIELKNTPGGAVFGTRQLANKKVAFSKPIVGFCEGMECSAGLYLGAPDDYKIIAHDSIIGCCGVMTSVADYKGYYEKYGIVVTDLYSKTSPLKNDAYRRAMKGDFKGYTDGILFKFDQSFMDFMQEHRTGISKTALQGADFVSEEGIENGLADAVGSFDDAYEKALEFAKNPSLASKQKSNNTMSKKVLMQVPAGAAAFLKAFGATEVTEEKPEQEDTTETPEEAEVETEEKPVAGAQAQKPGATETGKDPVARELAEVKALLASQKAEFDAFKAAASKSNPAVARSNARQQGPDVAPKAEEKTPEGVMEGEAAFKSFYMVQ